MASIRRLKKDIQFFTAEGISDCVNLIESQDNDKDEQILEIIREIASHHNKIMERINHPDGKDNSKMVKQFFKQLKADFIHGLDQSYKKMEELFKQQEK